MKEGVYILIFMIILFASISLWAFVFSGKAEKREEKRLQRRKEEKEREFQKLKADSKERRKVIQEKYDAMKANSDRVEKAL